MVLFLSKTSFINLDRLDVGSKTIQQNLDSVDCKSDMNVPLMLGPWSNGSNSMLVHTAGSYQYLPLFDMKRTFFEMSGAF